MKRTLLTRMTAILLGLVLTFMLFAMIGEQKVNAKADVKVLSVSFTVKDGDFVSGESSAKVTFKVSKSTKVVVEIKDSAGDTVCKKTYKKVKTKKNVSFSWDGKNSKNDEYYVKVTAGKASLTSDKLFFYNETGFRAGNGSKNNPYIVSTPEEFLNISRFNGRYFMQTQDLDFSSVKFNPVFTEKDPFKGVYDGNDKTVKNISYKDSSDYTGFFRMIGTDGVVRNLSFMDCSISGKNCVGIVTGKNTGEIENCSVEGCKINASKNYTGCIAGNNDGKITSCTARENILKNKQYGGGIAGYNGSNGNIKKCETTENTITGSYTDHGGITGASMGTIMMCKASDNTVSGGEKQGEYRTGGIAGCNKGVVSKCKVSNLKSLISGGGCTGGIVGINSDGGVDTGCVYSGGVIRQLVPQKGTWQFKTTPKTGFLIIGHDDDTADSAQFVRMVTGYGFPVTLNTEHMNQSRKLGGDADGKYTTYPAGSVSRFPDGTTVNELNKMVLEQNLGEIAQHDTAGGQTWDSSLLKGKTLNKYYAAYTAGGGLKSKADFKDAVKEMYADTDIKQGASRVSEQRLLLESDIDDSIYTIGTWGGKPAFIIDEINIGDITPLLCGTQKISRAQNYMGDGLLYDTHSSNPYYICRNSRGLEPAGITNVLANAYADKRCIEAFQHYYLDGTKAKWDDFKTTMDTIKSWVDQGKIQVVTRKQYYELGEFVKNPITSLSLTADRSEYNIGDTITASNFTCEANYQDNTQKPCNDDRILDYSNVDTSTVGLYTVYLEYRGFKTSVEISVVSSAFNLPKYIRQASDGYYQYVMFEDDKDKCYCIYVNEKDGGFGTGTMPFTSAGAYVWNFVTNNYPVKIFYSSDGGDKWSEIYTGNPHNTLKSNKATFFGPYAFNTTHSLITSAIVHIDSKRKDRR